MARKKHITGDARVQLRSVLKKQYDGGASIRALCGMHGRSYGLVNTLLKEAEVTMRPRGGSRRARPN
ncbi:helix-turn-helix domain-containing protein [Streptomyces californicus]|uniref:helix-turn-helix domain-containing protein n=1 Tax=Streptomyces californicus TaxID=67351 RepID=UPI00296F4234|nr:helix-turn-helix domain-containing protein [Streptomyces californicus]MDW4912590.1 helix-turn-helix domain-containing protein [Streptomyces californicus]